MNYTYSTPALYLGVIFGILLSVDKKNDTVFFQIEKNGGLTIVAEDVSETHMVQIELKKSAFVSSDEIVGSEHTLCIDASGLNKIMSLTLSASKESVLINIAKKESEYFLTLTGENWHYLQKITYLNGRRVIKKFNLDNLKFELQGHFQLLPKTLKEIANRIPAAHDKIIFIHEGSTLWIRTMGDDSSYFEISMPVKSVPKDFDAAAAFRVEYIENAVNGILSSLTPLKWEIYLGNTVPIIFKHEFGRYMDVHYLVAPRVDLGDLTGGGV